MPEGPSIVILKEATTYFIGEKVIVAMGNTKKLNLDLFRHHHHPNSFFAFRKLSYQRS